ncbi:MAG: class I SAM-dependent methyltransferase [Desulfobacterales bacterium]|jgi:SAM-dependent methyltransferase
MSIPQTYDFIDYLVAKKTIDDRSLNCIVWDRLQGALADHETQECLRVLEIGSGIGTMIERMATGPLTHRSSQYTAVDINPDCTRAARRRLSRWAKRQGFVVIRETETSHLLETGGTRIRVDLKTGDAYALVAEAAPHSWDLLLAHAFMDLVDIQSLLPGMMRLLKSGGLLFLSLNFDGDTVLLPAIAPEFDDRVIHRYHRSMDERIVDGRQAGDSRTGRRLLMKLIQRRNEILAAGASDWIVYPRRRRYPMGESYFLHHIIHTIDEELAHHPEIDPDYFKAWIAKRHVQIDNGELVFMAKHIDILARKTGRK